MGLGPQRRQNVLCRLSIVECQGSCSVSAQHVGVKREFPGHGGAEAGPFVQFQYQASDAQPQDTGEEDHQCQLSLNRAGSNERHFKSLGDRRLLPS